MEKDIIIVGAGIAGLSAGYYATLNGYKTLILESHNIPGGLCTAWGGKGYKFDISMHMLMGSAKGPFYQMWKELGVIDKFKFHYHKSISVIEGEGKRIEITNDRKKLEDQMIAISPEDKKLIKSFVKLIFGPHLMNAANLKPAELTNFFDSVRALKSVIPMISVFGRYARLSLQEYAQQFKDPFLQRVVRYFMDAPGWPMLDFPMIPVAGAMKSMVTEAGVPLGGSQQVVFHMAKLYKERGGEIAYKSEVEDLIIENDMAVGVRIKNGSEFRSQRVIWAGDGHTLIFDMLKEKYINENIKQMYQHWIPVRSIVHVMLGVDMDLSLEPHRLVFEAHESINIAGREHKWLAMLHHGFDSSMAPEGKSAVEVWYDTEYDYWENLYKDKEAYNSEKERIAAYTIQQLEKRWPGFTSKVEYTDVPTPITYKNYTHNWKGSPDGWYITTKNMRQQEPQRQLPGLKNLWMAGQWTAPFTGTVVAALTGRQVIEIACQEDKKLFKSN